MSILQKEIRLNIPFALIIKKLMELPNRFGHYRSSSFRGEWQCNLIDYGRDVFCFQLIDKTFEIPKGNVKPDVPLIILSISQWDCSSTIIKVVLRWKKLKLIFAWFLGVTFSICNIFMIMFIGYPQIGALLMLSGILQVFYLYWIISNIFHDVLTLKVFIELLKKCD